AIIAGLLVTGCAEVRTAAHGEPSSSSTGGGGDPATGGAGGTGGTGGTEVPAACEQDCSAVVVPQCLKSIWDEDAHVCVTVYEEPGTFCDDGLFCTQDETCFEGVCGGGSSTCAVPAGACTEGVCDEDAKQCGTKASANGVSCDLDASCMVNPV